MVSMLKGDKQTRTIQDWLTLVFELDDLNFPSDDGSIQFQAHEMIQSIFKFDWNQYDLTLMEHGVYEYSRAIAILQGTIIIGWNEKDYNNSFMIQISGRGLRNLDDVYPGGSIAFARCLNNYKGNWHCSRWDLARDFFNWGSRFSPAHIIKERKKGNLVSRATAFHHTESFDVSRPNQLHGRDRELLIGQTSYIGKSPFQYRCYNKLAERFTKTGIDFQYKNWYRHELQMNNNKAKYYFAEWLNTGRSLSDVWKLIMKANYRFVVNHDTDIDTHRNARRLATARWWSDMTNIDDDWKKAPALERMQTPAKTQKYYEQVVSKHAGMRLNRLLAGYLKNGVAVDDAKKLAQVQFLQELQRSIDDNEKWVVEHNDLYDWSDQND